MAIRGGKKKNLPIKKNLRQHYKKTGFFLKKETFLLITSIFL